MFEKTEEAELLPPDGSVFLKWRCGECGHIVSVSFLIGFTCPECKTVWEFE
jgi:phage FluMu protein Com